MLAAVGELIVVCMAVAKFTEPEPVVVVTFTEPRPETMVGIELGGLVNKLNNGTEAEGEMTVIIFVDEGVMFVIEVAGTNKFPTILELPPKVAGLLPAFAVLETMMVQTTTTIENNLTMSLPFVNCKLIDANFI